MQILLEISGPFFGLANSCSVDGATSVKCRNEHDDMSQNYVYPLIVLEARLTFPLG